MTWIRQRLRRQSWGQNRGLEFIADPGKKGQGVHKIRQHLLITQDTHKELCTRKQHLLSSGH